MGIQLIRATGFTCLQLEYCEEVEHAIQALHSSGPMCCIAKATLNWEDSLFVLHLQGHWHLAHVMADGSMKDSKGKLHLAPEDWLESILGNNIPVSSEYAWNKVRDHAALLFSKVLKT